MAFNPRSSKYTTNKFIIYFHLRPLEAIHINKQVLEKLLFYEKKDSGEINDLKYFFRKVDLIWSKRTLFEYSEVLVNY